MQGKSLLLLFLLTFSSEAVVSYSISGFSSGGFMAVQMHVANSASVFAAGIVAGGPYYCSMGSIARIQTACTANPYLISVDRSIAYAQQNSAAGLIDNVGNLTNAQVFLYSAQQDVRIMPGVVQQTLQFYQAFVNSSNIQTVFNNNGAHVWPTIGYGNPCSYYGSPYIGDCGYDTAGEILKQFYGKSLVKSSFNNSNLFPFDQSEWADVWQAGLSNRGWIYAPSFCRENPILCTLHINFHGCEQDYSIIGKTYVTETGFGEWAELNNIIVMFPQTVTGSTNVEGCWDFGGFTGANFAQQSGLQISAISMMAQHYSIIVQNLS